jgi:hypothetical protein
MKVTFVITLDPGKCQNPDLDIRYLLPEAIVAVSPGVISSIGYDYEEGTKNLLIYLESSDGPRAKAIISQFIETREILGNKLSICAKVSEEPS